MEKIYTYEYTKENLNRNFTMYFNACYCFELSQKLPLKQKIKEMNYWRKSVAFWKRAIDFELKQEI